MTLDERLGVPLVFLLCALAGFMLFWPASRYLAIDTFDVQDAVVGQVPEVSYDRRIVRDFDGRWQVSMWRNGESWCAAGNERRYDTDALLPRPVTLDWLTYTDPRCYEALPPGDYEIYLVIWINTSSSWLWQREVRRSDTFSVLADG